MTICLRWAVVVLALACAGPAPTVDRANLTPWPSSSDHERFRAIWALNDRRKALGLPYLTLDAGLNRAAQASAAKLGIGAEPPHAGFPQRVRDAGWPEAACGVRSGFGNVSEGISFGVRSPEEGVLLLDSSLNPAEGHRRDFEDPAFTHCGIGFAPLTRGPYAGYGGYVCVLDYGAKCR